MIEIADTIVDPMGQPVQGATIRVTSLTNKVTVHSAGANSVQTEKFDGVTQAAVISFDRNGGSYAVRMWAKEFSTDEAAAQILAQTVLLSLFRQGSSLS